MQAADFDFQQCIGQGSYAKVMLSKVINEESPLFGEEVAVKILDKKEMTRHNKQKYVIIEKNVFLACNHPNIVKLKSSFQDKLSLYFVMEVAKDGTLFDKIQNFKKLPEPLVRHWMGEVTLALEHMHSKNIVHRDLKPENVLIHEDHHVRVTDFGTCRILTEENENTAATPLENGNPGIQRKKSFVGTAEYVAPELLENRVEEFFPLDWWSLGIMIFQSLTGKTPFRGGSEYLTFQAIIEGNLNLPSELSPEAKDIISKLLNVDWKTRLGSNGAEEVKAHSFFKSVDWDALPTSPVPPEPEVVESKTANATPQDKHGEKPSFFKTLCCCCCSSGPEYKPNQNTCNDFLLENEKITCESLISMPSCMGLSSKQRVLILTDLPRLFFLDYKNQYVDIDVPWSSAIYASPQSETFFVLHMGKTSYDITLLTNTSGEWASRLNEIHNKNA